MRTHLHTARIVVRICMQSPFMHCEHKYDAKKVLFPTVYNGSKSDLILCSSAGVT